jgi:hypothetical protein
LADEVATVEEGIVPGSSGGLLKRFLLTTISQKGANISKVFISNLLKCLSNNDNKFALLSQNEIDLL